MSPSRTVPQQVRDWFLAELQAGRFRPGQKLTIEALVDAGGFTKSSVRAALTHLVEDGIVDATPGRGITILTRTQSASARRQRPLVVVAPLGPDWGELARSINRIVRREYLDSWSSLQYFVSDPETPSSALQKMAGTAGAVVVMPGVGAKVDTSLRDACEADGTPLVFVDRPWGADRPGVATDVRSGADQLVERVLRSLEEAIGEGEFPPIYLLTDGTLEQGRWKEALQAALERQNKVYWNALIHLWEPGDKRLQETFSRLPLDGVTASARTLADDLAGRVLTFAVLSELKLIASEAESPKLGSVVETNSSAPAAAASATKSLNCCILTTSSGLAAGCLAILQHFRLRVPQQVMVASVDENTRAGSFLSRVEPDYDKLARRALELAASSPGFASATVPTLVRLRRSTGNWLPSIWRSAGSCTIKEFTNGVPRLAFANQRFEAFVGKRFSTIRGSRSTEYWEGGDRGPGLRTERFDVTALAGSLISAHQLPFHGRRPMRRITARFPIHMGDRFLVGSIGFDLLTDGKDDVYNLYMLPEMEEASFDGDPPDEILEAFVSSANVALCLRSKDPVRFLHKNHAYDRVFDLAGTPSSGPLPSRLDAYYRTQGIHSSERLSFVRDKSYGKALPEPTENVPERLVLRCALTDRFFDLYAEMSVGLPWEPIARLLHWTGSEDDAWIRTDGSSALTA